MKLNVLVLTLLVMSCATVNVQSDYDTEFNFAQFKTYKIVNKSSSKAESKLPIYLEFNRISRAVEKDFNKKGFVKKRLSPTAL